MENKFRLSLIFLGMAYLPETEAQSKLETDIIGIWKSSKIYDIGAVIPDASKNKIELFQKKLLSSKFQFTTDHNFNFESSVTDMSIKNGHWKILGDNGMIVIQDWKDKDKERPVLMGITVLQKNSKTIFILEETFFAFEMVKISEK